MEDIVSTLAWSACTLPPCSVHRSWSQPLRCCGAKHGSRPGAAPTDGGYTLYLLRIIKRYSWKSLIIRYTSRLQAQHALILVSALGSLTMAKHTSAFPVSFSSIKRCLSSNLEHLLNRLHTFVGGAPPVLASKVCI